MSERGSPWLAGDGGHPRLEGALEVDVVVVGAGITRLTVASRLDAEGVSVAVLEADRLAMEQPGSPQANSRPSTG
jgi:glycerol-3-phosphate dehydrogenase